MKAPIMCAATVLIEHARNVCVVEELTLAHARVHQMRIEPLAQTITKPRADRRTETTLGAIEQIVRQDIFESALQDMLAASALDLQRARHAHRVLNQMMIEKG